MGQPPLDSIMATPATVARHMLETASDKLPVRWEQKWQALNSDKSAANIKNNLQEWLEETYFDGDRREDLTRDEIAGLGVRFFAGYCDSNHPPEHQRKKFSKTPGCRRIDLGSYTLCAS